jgi:hypothetical protein
MKDANNPMVIVQFTCPSGTTALQSSCTSVGPQACMVFQVANVNVVQCYIRVPPTLAKYTIAASATCANLKLVDSPGEAALESTA